MKTALLYLYLVAFFLPSGVKVFAQASVTTDQSDYPPGSTVQISGSGFTPGETVQLQVLNLTDPGDTGPEHQPWQVAADANGNVATTWYVTPDELGMTLQLTATGLSSGLTAKTTFTDGSADDGDGIMSVSPKSVTAGSTITNLTFDLQTANGKFFTSGEATIVVPADWTAPQTTNASAPGFLITTALGGGSIDRPTTVSGSGPWTIAIFFTSKNNDAFDVVYTNVTVPNLSGIITFTTSTRASTNSGSLVPIAVSPAFTNNVGIPSKLAFTTVPQTLTAGVASGTITVQVQDAAGNPTNSTARTVTLTSNSGGATTFSPASLTIGSSSTSASFTYTDTKAGTPVITVTSSGLTNAAQTETINPGASSRLAFTTQPMGTTNGATMTAVVVQLQDQFSNNVAGSGTNISLTLNGGGTLGGTTSLTADASGKAIFNNLNVTGAGGGATFTASASPLTGATSSSFNVAQSFTTAAANSSANPSVFGSNVVFSLTVSASAPGSGTPTGTVTFKDGATILGMSALVSGSATYTNGSLSVGSHSITVIYNGDANFIASTSSVLSQVVNKANQTITFGPLPSRTYGAMPFGLIATTSSGLPVSFSIASGPATISGTNLTITGAGTVTVNADQAGNISYNAATTVQQTFTVSAATLTVSGITASDRVYNGGTNAVLNVGGATLVGVIGSDNVTLNTGGATGYFTNSNVGAGKTVFVSGLTISGSSATNYSLTQPTTTASITQSSSTNAVSASANPSPTGSNVVLTATVSAIAPGGGTPTGTVQFLADGSPLGSPVAFIGGAASVTNNSLSNGFHIITVQYAGDGNFTGSTNNLNPNLLVNSAPMAQTATYPRPANFTLKIQIATLATNWSDADGGTITLSSVAATSTNGISMSKDNTFIYYNGPNGSNPDQFTYVISDGFVSTTGTVNIIVTSAPGTASTSTNQITFNGGVPMLLLAGIPGRTYYVQASTNLTAWVDISTNVAGTNGLWNVVDAVATNYPSRFYRTSDQP